MARKNLMKRVLNETDVEKRTRLWARKTKKSGPLPAVTRKPFVPNVIESLYGNSGLPGPLGSIGPTDE